MCGGVLEAPGDENENEAVKQEWETAVRMAVHVASQSDPGKIPGSLRRLIENLKKPKVSWRDYTRRFIDDSMIKDVSWSRLSRRSVSIGTLMPGYIADRLNHLVMFIDVSGSINDELMREFISEVAGALDEGTADRISVVYADTHVRQVDEWVQGDVVTASSVGGGGTSFADSFRWLSENAPNASCVIYLTDLEVSEFGEEPTCPVMWAVYAPTERYGQLSDNVPWGTPIHISTIMG
jgi:predicted metal-dependent peptidase